MTTLPTQPAELPPAPNDVTIEEAARLMGVSTATVRRRIKQGRLQAVKATTMTGFIYRVRLPDDAEGLTVAPTRMEGLRGLEGVVQAFRVELSSLVEVNATQGRRIEEQAEELGRLTLELEQARATIAALQAPQEEPESLQRSRGFPTDQTEPPARTWWQRLLWGS